MISTRLDDFYKCPCLPESWADCYISAIMEVIFLDIDGVLNCSTTKEQWRDAVGIDPGRVAIFNNIVQMTGARVVLSSTWRLDDDWRETLRAHGISADFFDRTPYLRGGHRGDEIREWLSLHPDVKKYAVIDDDFDLLPGQNIFKTSFEQGLTKEIADEVILHLT